MKNESFIAKLSNTGLSKLQGHYTLEEVPLHTYQTLQIKNMQMEVHQYNIQDVGNLLLLSSTNSASLQLFTFVLTPYCKALPLLSLDVMLMNTKRIFLLEYYDLVTEKNSHYSSYLEQFKHINSRYNMLPDFPSKPCWYDSLTTVTVGKSAEEANDEMLLQLFEDHLSTFIEMDYACPPLRETEKTTKWTITKEYVDNLIEKGGTSTDLFKAVLGRDETSTFFHSIFFGTGQ